MRLSWPPRCLRCAQKGGREVQGWEELPRLQLLGATPQPGPHPPPLPHPNTQGSGATVDPASLSSGDAAAAAQAVDQAVAGRAALPGMLCCAAAVHGVRRSAQLHPPSSLTPQARWRSLSQLLPQRSMPPPPPQPRLLLPRPRTYARAALRPRPAALPLRRAEQQALGGLASAVPCRCLPCPSHPQHRLMLCRLRLRLQQSLLRA